MLTLNNFYTSKPWVSFIANLRLERVNEDGLLICEHCGKPITAKYDCIGHHKIELTDDNVNDYSISLNPDNVMLIHFKCHNELHQRWNGFRQKVFIVYGAPCSGKAEWVKQVANPDDLILDIDNLWEAISNAKRYDKPNRLKANVFGLRDCLIDQIKIRCGKWRNAYIIGGYPLRSDRQRLQTLLNAEVIYIESSKENCLERAAKLPEAYKEYIEDWFDSFIPD